VFCNVWLNEVFSQQARNIGKSIATACELRGTVGGILRAEFLPVKSG
jgi:hypothetical protein